MNPANAVKASDFLYMAPLTVLTVAGLLLIVAEAFTRSRSRAWMMPLTVTGCIAAGLAAVAIYRALGGDEQVSMFGGMLIADRPAMFVCVLLCAGTAFTALVSPLHQVEFDWENGEYYGMLLLAAAGMVMMAMAGDLVATFLGIETMSLAVYVLTASRRGSRRATEGAMKYFLMGAFATAFLLYGIALIYGATGTTDLVLIAERLAERGQDPLVVIGVMLLIVAFGFKVAAVPFHMWTPDAYEGAATPVTGFMAAVVKAAAFAGALRVFDLGFGGDYMPLGSMGWGGVFAVLAAITMTVGNLAALRQENVKRMLAYSSVSHAGVLLVGLVAIGLSPDGPAHAALLYYLAAYAVTTLGAFAAVIWIGSREQERVLVDDWAGLASRHPSVALAMTLFLLSLGGIPPTSGFFGKFAVFQAAMQAPDGQLLWLVVVGVLNSVLSIFYYLRLVMSMYFREPLGEFKPLRSGALTFALVACALLVLQMGIMPGFWLGLTGG
ncbi:MAG TPA: NADH-quinone oxidoreductase subunit N [Kofleriaceae bacterium]|nr:NADH-quinone oxidoreductase subunit N [Kofleriaceae bacterium]